MKIKVSDFESSRGVKYTITATNETERVLLFASVNVGGPLQEGDEATDFYLHLEVSN